MRWLKRNHLPTIERPWLFKPITTTAQSLLV
jgi:hypothetical protein